MCRDDNHGGRRCPSDTSQARRARRKAVAALERVSATQPVIQTVEAVTAHSSIEQLNKEINHVKELLHQPIVSTKKQQAIDVEIELKITRIGQHIAEEVTRRMEFSLDTAREKIDTQALLLDNELSELHEQIQRNNTRKWEINDFLYSASDEAENIAKEKELDAEMDTLFSQEHELDTQILAKEKEIRLFKQDAAKKISVELSQKNREVLAELRQLGGTLSTHPKSDIEAVELLNKTVGENFPSDWIEASNAKKDNMRIISVGNSQRPYYGTQSEQYDIDENTVIKNAEIVKFIPYKFAHEAIVKLGYSEGKVTGDPDNSFIMSENSLETVFVTMEKRIPFNTATDVMKNGKPEGDNWYYGYTYTTPDTDSKTGLSAEREWYKLESRETVLLPEIALPYAESRINNAEATAYHEFAHRAEYAVENNAITRLEQAFLVRRTTDNTTQQRESLSAIYPHQVDTPGEWGRRDDFIHHYMGKEYLDTKHREVLSMGVESVFSGERGGLVGMEWTNTTAQTGGTTGSWTKPDNDYLAFCLGVLATA